MKIARLPNGEMMEFPPDYPDDEMDRAVRQKMGVPEEPSETELVMQLIQQLTQQLVAVQAQIVEGQRQHQEVIAQLVHGQQLAAQSQQQATVALKQSIDQLAAAYAAPRTIIKDGAGKPVGLKIGGK